MEIDLSTKPASDPGKWHVIHTLPAGADGIVPAPVRFRVRAIPAAFRRWRAKIRLKGVDVADFMSAKGQESRLSLNLDLGVYALSDIEELCLRLKDEEGAKLYSRAAGKPIAVGDPVDLAGPHEPPTDPDTLTLTRQFLSDHPAYLQRVLQIAEDEQEALDKLEKKGA